MSIHRRVVIDLSQQRAEALTDAQKALDAEDQAAFDAAMQQVENLDQKIAMHNRLVSAEESAPTLPMVQDRTPEAPAMRGPVDELRGSREYARAFCAAVRNGLSPQTAGGHAEARVLLDALTEGTNADGGFLVPVDLQTRIHELMREMNPLRQLVRVERVTTNTGSRVLDTKPTTGFTQLSEMGQIPTDGQPSFSRISYAIKDYGLIVPISNDLLADNDAGLLEYLARWMARKRVITENTAILAKLATLTKTSTGANGVLSAIKTALNVTLDPAISTGASLLTNQTGYNYLDSLTETDSGRPLLQPDIAKGSGFLVKGKPIHCASNAQLANITGSGAGTPLYVGNFAEFVTIFERQAMEFTTTNIGGNAWRTNSTEGRAILRMDCVIVDSAAVAALKITT